MSPVPRPRMIGPYRVLKPLGQGASGSVFLGVHQDLGWHAAIKVMAADGELTIDSGRSTDKRTRLARFVREGRTLTALSCPGHPGIVRVFDCRRNKTRTRAYLVMEYIEGVSLRRWLSERAAAIGRTAASSVPTAVTVEIVTQLAAALCFIHSHGVVHRDVKPENIIVRSPPIESQDAATAVLLQVTLVDFGIAKVSPSLSKELLASGASPSLTTLSTHAGAILGTVGYMAPEQCLGQPVSDRADVYALGVILFELLSGEPPFKADSAVELLIQHVQHHPPALSEFAAQRGVAVPRWLSSLVSSMLEKGPEQRPSMAEVFATLQAPPVADSCPLPGLAALDAKSADLLIGRSLDTTLIAGWVDDALLAPHDLDKNVIQASAPPSRWIVIEGSAGAGKTSVMQAGVVPTLCSRPSGRARSVCMLDTAADSLAKWLNQHAQKGSESTVVWMDQVERILAGTQGEVTQWADALVRILSLPMPVVVITVVRRDALARLRGVPALRALTPHVCALPVLTSAMLGEAVMAICRRGRIRLGEGLRERVVRDAMAASVPLAFLHLFFKLLWQRRGAVSLSLTEYEQLLGSAGLVRFLAESVERDLGRLDPTELSCARSIVLALVWPGRGLPDSPRTRTKTELQRAAGFSPAAETALHHLCGEGALPLNGPPLLVASGGDDSLALTLIHDAVLTEIPSIADWIATARPSLEYLAHVEELAGDWENAGRPAVDLPQGTLLRQYTSQQVFLAQLGTLRAQHFIAAALTLERRKQTRTRWLRGFVAVAVLAVLGSAQLAWLARARAMASAREAAAARDRANNHLRQILGLVEQIATDTDWDLATQPDPAGRLLEIRQKTLNAAEAQLGGVTPEELEQPGVRTTRIQVRQRLADLHYWQAKLSGAERWLALAHEDISFSQPSSKDREQLSVLDALYWSKQGKVALASGHWSEATADFEKSLNTFNQLVTAPDEPSSISKDDLLLSIATSKSELGLTHIRPAAPPAEKQTGIRLLHDAVTLIEQAGSSPYHRGLAADVKLHLAEQAIKDNQLAEAAVLLSAASDQVKLLHQEAPTDMRWRTSLVCTHLLRGRLLAAQGQTEPAGAALVEAVDIGHKLLADQPPSNRHKGQLLMVASALADLADHLELAKNARGAVLRQELCRLVSAAAAADPEDTRLTSPRGYACLGREMFDR